MAILANRSKEKSIIVELVYAMPVLLRRSSIIIFICLSLNLLYIAPAAQTHSIALEFSGRIIGFISKGVHIAASSLKNLIESVNVLQDLRTENTLLKLEIEKLKITQRQNLALINENTRLKQALNFASELEYQSISGRLIAIDSSPFSRSAIVQAGRNQGVEKEQVVISKDGVIGRISEVSDNYSKVLLVTDALARIPVLSEHTRLQAIVAGCGNDRASLLYLPDNSTVKTGEMLLTSGDGKYYPAGLEVGKVINSPSGELFVIPTADPRKVDFVNILKPNRK